MYVHLQYVHLNVSCMRLSVCGVSIESGWRVRSGERQRKQREMGQGERGELFS